MPYRSRPWQTDSELEHSSGAPSGYGAVRIRARPPAESKPMATYGLLLAFLIVLVLEFIVFYALGEAAFENIFTIYAIDSRIDWINRPWSPLTATISHSVQNVGHILFNGL